jgi:gluconolactonase
MFPEIVPEVVTAEVLTALPESLRGRAHLLEGPSFDREGTLHCVDTRMGRIYRITPTGDWSVLAEYDGQPNGLKIHRDGRIFIADRKNGVMVLDPKGGEPQTVLNGPAPGERFLGLNDLVFSDTGDLYFTDQGRSGLQDPCGRVFRFQPDGTLTKLIDNVPSPNGLVLNARGNALYIAVTRANCVWRMELDDPQHRTGLFVQLPSAGPDGMALDDKGNVAVTHPTYGGVWLFSRLAEPLFWIRSPAGEMTTNIAYGGADMRTLYITESRTSSILTVRLTTPGRLMFSHR